MKKRKRFSGRRPAAVAAAVVLFLGGIPESVAAADSVYESGNDIKIDFDMTGAANGRYFKENQVMVLRCGDETDPEDIELAGYYIENGGERISFSISLEQLLEEKTVSGILADTGENGYELEFGKEDTSLEYHFELASEVFDFVIDRKSPVITISYDNNQVHNGRYFCDVRKMTLTVTEENYAETEECLSFQIYAADGIRNREINLYQPVTDAYGHETGSVSLEDLESLKNDIAVSVEEIATEGSAHIYTIVFGEKDRDFDYLFVPHVTDLAGNTDEGVVYEETVTAGRAFTVDMAAPVCTVRFRTAGGEDITEEIGKSGDYRNWYYTSQAVTAYVTVVERNLQIPGEEVSFSDGDQGMFRQRDGTVYTEEFRYAEEGVCLPELVYADLAGNTVTYCGGSFVVDRTALRISADLEGKEIHNQNISLRITVTDPAGNGSCTGVKTASWELFHEGRVIQTGCYDAELAEAPEPVQSLVRQENIIVPGNYEGPVVLRVSASDYAGNETRDTKEIWIDTREPLVTVTFDQKHPENGKYYKEARTATVHIYEDNFDPDGIEMEAVCAGGTVSVRDGWKKTDPSSAGSRTEYVCDIVFAEDGVCRLNVRCRDRAGNDSNEVKTSEFVIDQTPPRVEFSSVEDQAAYNGRIAPGILCTDDNLDGGSVSMICSGVYHAPENLDGILTEDGDGIEAGLEDFPYEESADDIYTLSVRSADLAGNITETSICFSVNRFGSNYRLTEKSRAFVEKKYNRRSVDLVIEEINVNDSESRISYGLDGEIQRLEEGTGYMVQRSGDETSWKSSLYTVKAENFKREGVYSVTIESLDAADNQVNNRIKNLDLSFVIDQTPPEIRIAGIEDGETYRTDSREISVIILDNIAADTAEVWQMEEGNEVLCQKYDREEIYRNGGTVSYTLSSGREKQYVKAVAVDLAGNIADTSSQGTDHEGWIEVTVSGKQIFPSFSPEILKEAVALPASGSRGPFLIPAGVAAGTGFTVLIIRKRRKGKAGHGHRNRK